MSTEDLDNARRCARQGMDSAGLDSSIRTSYSLSAIAWALIAAVDKWRPWVGNG